MKMLIMKSNNTTKSGEFTKGKWEVRGNKVFIEGKTKSICAVHIQNSWDSMARPIEDFEAKANARLIAAAPDMYKALTDFIEGNGRIMKAKTIIKSITNNKISTTY